MFKIKFIASISICITFLILTSLIKNKTRVIEKKILILNSKIASQKIYKNEAQLEFYYLTSPAEIEKRLDIIGFDDYKPIVFSKLFLNIEDFTNFQKKLSNLENFNEKKIKKR